MFTIVLLGIALLTAILPMILQGAAPYLPAVKMHPSHNWLPALAAFLFIAAWFLPDIHISCETTTFQQHFVGGGTYCACLFVYVQKLLGWKLSLLPTLVVLFAWVSAFGVANEFMEFTATKLQLAQIDASDTDWDLIANTLGAFAGYLLLRVGRIAKR